MDLQSIQTKLIQTVNTLNQSDAGVQVDWASGPQLPATPPHSAPVPRSGVEFTAAVDVLQWRAETNGGYGPSPEVGGAAGANSAVPMQVYLKRFSAMADKINYLSAEQERTIAEMQTIQARMAQFPHPFGPQGQPVTPPGLDASRAALAAAEVDGQGNIFLCYRTIAPGVGNAAGAPTGRRPREADQLATHLRATYGQPATQPGWAGLVTDVVALTREPLQLASTLGRGVWGLAVDLGRLVDRRRAGLGVTDGLAGRSGGLSLVDSVLWFGGGVIGRLGLNLLLAAFPALWSVAVAAITAITAYALYRATLAPKLAFGPAVRVFLLVVGLMVGGQL